MRRRTVGLVGPAGPLPNISTAHQTGMVQNNEYNEDDGCLQLWPTSSLMQILHLTWSCKPVKVPKAFLLNSFNGLHPCWKEIEGNEAKLKTQHDLQRGVGAIRKSNFPALHSSGMLQLEAAFCN